MTQPGLPAEFRALGAVVAIDLCLGVWLSLHREGSASLLYLAQLPAVGLGALLWGFMTDEAKKTFGEWLATLLRGRVVLWGLGVAGGLLLAASFVRSSVVVSAVDPDVSTTIYVVDGRQTHPVREALEQSDSLRLNRLTTPARLGVWLAPWGKRVWLRTPTAVSFVDYRVCPWLPTKLHYPDDFVPLAALAVLPASTILSRLKVLEHRLTVLAGDAGLDTAAHGPLRPNGVLIAFLSPPPMLPEVAVRWRDTLATIASEPDSAARAKFVAFMLDRWKQAWQPSNLIAARRPIRRGELVIWHISSAAGVVATGKVRLLDAVTDLHLVF